MTDYTKPVSASNPPESRGTRDTRESTPLVPEEGDTETDRQLVYEPTTVAPSPAAKRKVTDKNVTPK